LLSLSLPRSKNNTSLD